MGVVFMKHPLKIGIKLRSSFLHYCGVYRSKTASQTRTNVGRVLILSLMLGLDWELIGSKKKKKKRIAHLEFDSDFKN